VPTSFPDLETLVFTAEIWEFRPPVKGESDARLPRRAGRAAGIAPVGWLGAASHSGEEVEARATVTGFCPFSVIARPSPRGPTGWDIFRTS
jgi:hypothetical protein